MISRKDEDFEGPGRWRVPFPSGLQQPVGAMRFAVDSLLLPCFVAASLKDRPLRVKNPLRETAFDMNLPGYLACADLGCGCGASSLALMSLVGNIKLWGVDIVDEMVMSARQNAAALDCGRHVRFDTRDVAELACMRRPCCDLVQMNPPYWQEGEGMPSSRPMNERARRSTNGLRDFLAAARQLTVFHGRLFVIFPANRLFTLLQQIDEHGFGVRRLQAVRPFADTPAGRVLVEAQRDAAHETVWEPDIVLYERSRSGRSVPTSRAKTFCPWLQ
ncbi:MAG: methyltransferase domain-containing protein [Desulfovibrionaceae bacterium]|nr:methyltransferase domain-containing protein [Desulfovibrionaceae bacterium]